MNPGAWILVLLFIMSVAGILHCTWRFYRFALCRYFWAFPGNIVVYDGIDMQVWKDAGMWYARIPTHPSMVVLCLTKDEALMKLRHKLLAGGAPTLRIVGAKEA